MRMVFSARARLDNTGDLISQQHDVGGGASQIGTARHCDPDIGGDQSWGIIDPVADEGDFATLGLQVPHNHGFLFRLVFKEDRICSGAQTKCGGREIHGRFQGRLFETDAGLQRTFRETERKFAEIDARS
jgi:hypothetical protein